MRGFVNPRKSAAHKLACSALYRSLLRQSIRFADETTSTALVNLIRHRFHYDQSINSPTVICDTLKKGRQARTVIQAAADGSPTALAQLTSTLDQVAKHSSELADLRTHQNSLRSPTSPGKLSKIAHVQDLRSKQWAEKIPNPIPVLDRPVPQEQLPNPEKPRRVPILASSQGIPFLRYKAGAQSPKLSRILRDIYARDFKRWEAIIRLQDEIEHARLEDDWDKILCAQSGYQDTPDTLNEYERGTTKSWTEDTKVALKEMQQKHKESASRKTEMTFRMWDIVQREKELATREKAERRAKRIAEREREQTAE